MLPIALNQTTLHHFRTRLRGELILPGDENYDRVRRVWNGSIDRYPDLIVRCADPSGLRLAGLLASFSENARPLSLFLSRR